MKPIVNEEKYLMKFITETLIKSPADLRTFDLGLALNWIWTNRRIPTEEAERLFRMAGAFWKFDYDRPAKVQCHAELTSGKHSNGYLNCSLVLQHPKLAALFAAQLIALVHEYGLMQQDPTVVIGSGNAAITFSYEVARQINCRHAFTEKGAPDGKVLSRFEILPGDQILMVEELVTTMKTAKEQVAAVQTAAIGIPFMYLPVLAVLVNRSGESMFNGAPIISVFDASFDSWEPGDCLLCQQGSKVIKPKANWAELTGTMDTWSCQMCRCENPDSVTICQHCHVARQMA